MTAAPASRSPSRVSTFLRRPELAVFLVALAVRFLALMRFAESAFFETQGGDSKFYHEWALRILHGQWTDHHAFYGLPGYAYLLAGLYRVFGVDPFVPAALQAVAEAITAALVCAFARRMVLTAPEPARETHAAEIAGAVAGLGWILFVPAQTFAAILMPTSLLVAAYWGGVWLIMRWRETSAVWRWGALGAGIGAVAMLIATILFLLPLAIGAALWRGVPMAWPRRALAAGLALAGVFTGCAPAWVHNTFIAHEPVLLSAHGGINFYIGNYPEANGYPKIPPGLRTGQQELLDDSIRLAEQAAGHKLTRPEVSRYWSAKAWVAIRENPARWLGLLGWKLQAFWSPYVYDDLTMISLLRQGGIVWPGISFGLASAFGFLGLVLAVQRNPTGRWVAAGVLLHMLALLPVFITERYRLAAVPGLLALAAYAGWRMTRWFQATRWQPLAGCAAVLALWWVAAGRAHRDEKPGSMEPYNLALSELDAAEHVRAEMARGKADPAKAEMRERLLNQAAAHLERVRELAPNDPRLELQFGRYWSQRGDLSKAADAYAAALALDANFEDALINLAVIDLQQKRPSEAAKLLERAAKLSPGEAGTFYLLARALSDAGDREGARKAIGEAVRLEPGNGVFGEFRKRLGP